MRVEPTRSDALTSKPVSDWQGLGMLDEHDLQQARIERQRKIYVNSLRNGWASALLGFRSMPWLVLGLLLCGFPVLGQSQPSLIDGGAGLGSARVADSGGAACSQAGGEQVRGRAQGKAASRTWGERA